MLKCLNCVTKDLITGLNPLLILISLRADLKVNKGCKGCDKRLRKGKMPPQAQENGLQLYKIEEDFKDLCPLETMLLSRVIPFMFIVPRHKGAQFGLKGQCVLVPADLKKI